ncbi:DUF4112 domain-containing protein [Pelagerythrobacter marinus]|jgi:hypothetical protein|uniref:DUF4112 domain-containing protein n=1 Tax=Pelagerythrobacter marinus TaxID=538382 RepID=A0ABW9UZ54_9SPHN|nr:DUF4112 domain-containing protein [Pelagerythrobacter marinus]MXO68687.1 DUF4112 domain-containing protein [Pelagerythrobacter marinus]USA38996.1 DUF4112 domain-containing protein [Pelagerythrobacter marinus]WPZ06920.1 DUF4112 domain-containing protein [Pelagerythrobacter marinus]
MTQNRQQQPRPMGVELPTGTDPQSIRRRIETMEFLLERSFRIPGINYAVGLDAIVGLVPVVGDLITAAMGGYIVWEARNLGLPKWKLWRMAGNIAFDTALGAVPLAGDAFDLAFRSNTRNLKIVRKHLDKHHPETRTIEG